MYCVELHKTINLIISSFYRLGLWHQGDEPTIQEMRLMLFYSIYYFLFPVSSLAGAITSDNKDESIFLVLLAISTSVLALKLFYIIWKKHAILELLNRICVHSIDDREESIRVNDKLRRFMKFVNFLLVLFYTGTFCAVVVTPFLGSEKKLFFAIGFPLDWKNDEFSYWIAFAFLFTQAILTLISFLFSVIIWYLMMNCVVEYEMLGNEIRNMGGKKVIEETRTKRKISTLEKEKIFLGDHIESIQLHRRIREDIEEMGSFLSVVFLAQVATSGLCICGSIYNLVFGISDNLMEHIIYFNVLLYNLFEIFMVMYLGDEIKSSSDCLTYCLFESDWLQQPQSVKKYMIIFAEILKQPHEIVVGKLYPLTLETFTRILNSGYSWFNILKNFK